MIDLALLYITDVMCTRPAPSIQGIRLQMQTVYPTQDSTLGSSPRFLLVTVALVTGPEQPRNKNRPSQHAADKNKPHQHIPRRPDLMLAKRIAHGTRPARAPPHILRSLRPEMPARIEMIDGIAVYERGRIVLILLRPSIPIPSPRRRLTSPPIPIPAMSIETRRRAPERAAPFTQPARRPRPRIRPALVVYAGAAVAPAVCGCGIRV